MSNRQSRRARTSRATQHPHAHSQAPFDYQPIEEAEETNQSKSTKKEEQREPDHASTQQGAHRQRRLETLLLEEFRALLRDEVRDPALGAVFPLALELSGDGGTARIAYACEAGAEGPSEREAAHRSGEALARATGFLRARLAAALDLKRLPKLAFRFVGLRDHGALQGEGGEPCP